MALIQQLHMEFIIVDPLGYSLSMVKELYANLQVDVPTQFVMMRGVQVNMFSVAINSILETSDKPLDSPIKLQIRPTYQAMRHSLASSTSTARWMKHGIVTTTCHSHLSI